MVSRWLSVAVLSISIGPAALSAHAEIREPATALLITVCIPVMTGNLSESQAIRAARLHQTHPIWFPQSTPPGLRQYAGPYRGVSVVNLTDDSCLIHVQTGDYTTAFQELRALTSERRWRLTAAAIPRHQVFCDPPGTVGVSAEANTNGTSYDLRVTRRPAFCSR